MIDANMVLTLSIGGCITKLERSVSLPCRPLPGENIHDDFDSLTGGVLAIDFVRFVCGRARPELFTLEIEGRREVDGQFSVPDIIEMVEGSRWKLIEIINAQTGKSIAWGPWITGRSEIQMPNNAPKSK